MTKVSTAKAKGRVFESACCAWINNNIPGAYCMVRAKEGAKDEGDLRLLLDGLEGTIECKNYAKGRNKSGKLLPSLVKEFRRQTTVELGNSGADWAVLIVNTPGCSYSNPESKNFTKHEVHIPLPDGEWEVITLGEWAKRMGADG